MTSRRERERRAGTHAQPDATPTPGREEVPPGRRGQTRPDRPPPPRQRSRSDQCSLSAARIYINENMFVVGQNKHKSSARCRPHILSDEYAFVVGRNKHRSEADSGFTSWQFLVLKYKITCARCNNVLWGQLYRRGASCAGSATSITSIDERPGEGASSPTRRHLGRGPTKGR